MKVVCINDSKLPTGADIIKDKEYEVVDTFINFADQVVYIIAGAVNEGKTRFDMPWHGYSSDRFKKLEDVEIESLEYNYALD